MHILLKNKKIHVNYHIIETVEAGISLKGCEVKSVVKANANINQAFIIFKHNEAYLLNMYIAPYKKAWGLQLPPERTRKLLLHKKEITNLQFRIKKEKLACIPNAVYSKNNKIKLEIALCKSKNVADKRQDIKNRDLKREIKKFNY